MSRSPRGQRCLPPSAWGLDTLAGGELAVRGRSVVELAHTYGTPLHVVDLVALTRTARELQDALARAYPCRASVHYAFKANSVPAIVGRLRDSGLKAEVMSPFELDLALRLGYAGRDIVVNGPFKPEPFLRACLAAGVRFIVADSPAELATLARLGAERAEPIDILLRINPNIVPHGMNAGSATASRTGSPFGLDLVGGEADRALDLVRRSLWLRCAGLHVHIGTGIHHPGDYARALTRLAPFAERCRRRGVPVRVLDAGGGFGARTTREMTGLEMLRYQATGRLPPPPRSDELPTVAAFAHALSDGLRRAFGDSDLPELLLEPGRALVSSCQLLLLTVHAVKERAGAGKWLITDGGLGTVTLPTFYEYHEVLLADDPLRPRTERVTITGPGCFSGDVVYRNKAMPRVWPGEVLAVMDSGAYFTALESSFGHPRPAIVAVAESGHVLIRRRETLADMTARDRWV